MAASGETPPRMNAQEVEAFLDREFPQMNHGGKVHHVEEVRPMGAVVRLAVDDRNLRPGGTVSGPSMMALADYSMYVALLAQIGPVGLAVTTSLSINFLRRPPLGDLYGDCSILKLGRQLAVGEVSIRSDRAAPPVAHAVLTYSMPPNRA